MNRSAFFLLLGLQLSYCMSINQTHSTASSNSSICTEALESASVVNLCKIYNWFGGLTNLFRKTGEVVSEIEDTFFVDPEIVSQHHGYGDEVKCKTEKFFMPIYTLFGRFKSLLIMRTSLLMKL